VGGRNYQKSQYNRTIQAKRQSGSCFKPVVVSLFLDRFKPSDLLSNEEKTYQVGNTSWTPKNFSETGMKKLTVCDMLRRSANRAAVDFMVRGGVDDAVQKLKAYGFSNQFKPYPSLILGSSDVSLMDMALAYSTFAADGIQPYPLSLKGVADDHGVTQLRKHIEMKTVLSPSEAYIMTSMLKTVIQEGTGKMLKEQGIFFPVAGKTGTTNDFRDGWFIGYTPDILALVWVGHDDGSTILLPAGKTALPIWSDLINTLPDYISGHDFAVPPGVLQKTICRESGMLAIRKRCTDTHDEFFLDHLIPTEPCTLHRKKSGNMIQGLKNIFKKNSNKQDDQDVRP